MDGLQNILFWKYINFIFRPLHLSKLLCLINGDKVHSCSYSFIFECAVNVLQAFALLTLCFQASEGVPIRFFTILSELVEAYYKENMGLVTHLQYPVQKEEEPEDEPGRKQDR